MMSVARVPIHIEWDSAKCSNCMSCMVVCAERHTGMSSPHRARIQILIDPIWNRELAAHYCRQCEDAPCAEVCPSEAILFDGQLGAWIMDEALCTGCGLCEEACPYEAIQLDLVSGYAAKCDLCHGAVRCVEICAPQALTLVADAGGA